MVFVAKSAGIEAAKIGGDSPVMDATAAKIKLTVLAVAAPHSKSGTYARKVVAQNVRGKRGVRDRTVSATDRESMQIEYGHWLVTPEGVRVKWVKGIRIMNRAFEIWKGRSR